MKQTCKQCGKNYTNLLEGKCFVCNWKNRPERISNCCGAELIMDEGCTNTAMCSECNEWCSVVITNTNETNNR